MSDESSLSSEPSAFDGGAAASATTEPSDAEQIVGTIRAWIGWELWECGHKGIKLDGDFTLPQLRALVDVLSRDAAGGATDDPR